MLKTLSIALVLAVTACGGGSKKEPTTTTDTAAKTEATGVTLALGELKILDTSKNQSLLIHADGTIEVDGQKPAKVTTTGTIVTADGSKTVMTLTADGSIKGPDGADLGAKLAADGSLTMGTQTISIDDTGVIQGGNPSAPQLKVEGATDANLKRTAMFVLIALMSGAEAPPPASATTPAVTP